MYRQQIICRRAYILSIISLLAFWAQISESKADETNVSPRSSMGNINDLTRRILTKEIELERFSIDYHLQESKNGISKRWRYFLSQESNDLLINAGLIANTAERAGHIQTPQNVNIGILERSLIPRIVGTFLAVGGSMTELWISLYNDHKACKRGLCPKLAREHMLNLHSEITRLIFERDSLIKIETKAPMISPRIKIAEAESEILKDILDLTLTEFARFQTKNKQLKIFRRSLYVMDATNNAIFGTASIIPLVGLHTHNYTLDGVSGTLIIIAGSLISIAPILCRSISKMSFSDKKVPLEACTTADFKQKLAKLNRDIEAIQHVSRSSKTSIDELMNNSVFKWGFYQSQSKSFASHLECEENEEKTANLIGRENTVMGMLLGGSLISSGVLYGIAGFSYAKKPKQFNELIFAGNIPGIAGLSLTALDTAKIRIADEIHIHHSEKNNSLPAQILKERLTQIDQINQLINSH